MHPLTDTTYTIRDTIGTLITLTEPVKHDISPWLIAILIFLGWFLIIGLILWGLAKGKWGFGERK